MVLGGWETVLYLDCGSDYTNLPTDGIKLDNTHIHIKECTRNWGNWQKACINSMKLMSVSQY